MYDGKYETLAHVLSLAGRLIFSRPELSSSDSRKSIDKRGISSDSRDATNFSKFKQLRLTSHLSHAHTVCSLLDFRDCRFPLIRLEMDEQQKSIVPSGPFISPFAP